MKISFARWVAKKAGKVSPRVIPKKFRYVNMVKAVMWEVAHRYELRNY